MKFANKNLEKNIAAQISVIASINSDISKLDVAMSAVFFVEESKVIYDALFDKYFALKCELLPVEEQKLVKLHRQNELSFSNRVNRRAELIGSMYTPERVFPA